MKDRTLPPNSNPSDADIAALLAAAGLHPTDSFRAALATELEALAAGGNVAVLRSSTARSTRRNRTTVALVAAAAVVLIVAIAVVGSDESADLVPVTVPTTEGDDAVQPIPTPDPAELTGDDLFEELAGRRWVALERFDRPSATSLTADVTVTGYASAPVLVAHDGCVDYSGRFEFDGSTIVTNGFSNEGQGCSEVVTLPIGDGQSIEMLPDATTFMLMSDQGDPIARFTDYDSLDLATSDNLAINTVVDGVNQVRITPTGRVFLACTAFGWAERDGRIVVTLDDPDQLGCAGQTDVDGAEIDETVVGAMRELTTAGAELRRTDDGLLLAAERGAIHLRSLPRVDVDPTGVTIAAGAIFGIEPGIGVTPDDVLIAATPVLGDPDLDTGWITDAGDGQMANCGLTDYRELVWGNLVFGFWATGSRTELLFWHVGDERIVSNNIPRVDRPDTDPIALTTEQGVGVGDQSEELPDLINMRSIELGDLDSRFETDDVVSVAVASPDPDFTFGGRAPALRSGNYLVVDGTVIAFGAEDFYC